MRAFTTREIPKPALDFQIPDALAGLDLEIGAGQGLHAIRYCQANPERVLVAIEKTSAKFAGLAQRRTNHPGLTNLIAIHADAVAFVRYYVQDASLDRVFLLYPNPYPKARQANLRWHNRPFFSLLLQKMKADAELHLATNLAWYADEAKSAFVNHWGLSLLSEGVIESSDRNRPRTHFEKKYLERGEVCRNLVFKKS